MLLLSRLTLMKSLSKMLTSHPEMMNSPPWLTLLRVRASASATCRQSSTNELILEPFRRKRYVDWRCSKYPPWGDRKLLRELSSCRYRLALVLGELVGILIHGWFRGTLRVRWNFLLLNFSPGMDLASYDSQLSQCKSMKSTMVLNILRGCAMF